jgi:hypothetical protein
MSIKHVHDLKPSYENPIYLVHSSKHKTLVAPVGYGGGGDGIPFPVPDSPQPRLLHFGPAAHKN